MKFVLKISMWVLLVGLALAQRDPICNKKPQVIGQCPENNLGYSYITDHGCEEYNALGCYISGNFFNTREDCNAKCSPSWEARIQDFYLRSMNALGRVVTELMSSVRRFL